MNSPKIHPKHPINLALIVLTGLVALLGYTWRASSPNLAIQPVSTSTPLKHDRPSQAQVSEAYGKLPLRFEANQGQTDHQVKFISRGSGYNLFLTCDEAVLTLRNANHRTESDELHTSDSSIRAHRPSSRADTTLRMKIVGANPNPQVAGQEELPGKVNYFIGNDPKKWRTNIPTYGKVMYRDVYPGVDLVYYGNRRQLEYDFVLGPGADPNQIRLEFDGAEEIRIDEAGDLVLTTNGGAVRQHKPVVYQEVDGSRKEIAGSYVVKANREVGFEIGSYNNIQPLVIDPILVYSTYLGGTLDEIGNGIAVDSSGAAYVTGRTASLNFPTTSGAFQTVFAGSPYEVFVTKLNPAGNAVVYSTYLGGADFDDGFDLAVDSSGNAYVTGNTKSANFPTTSGAFQTVFSGGPNFGDAFVAKLSVAGDSLVYSTYLGGSNDDRGWGIALDTSGAAYVTGETRSSNFPLLNQFQGFPADFNNNGFVTKLNTTGSALAYSTYLGGNSYDQGTDIAIDPSGKAYVTGMTQSTTFPTANAFQSTLSSGFLDAFVTKIDPALSGASSLIYSTYLGGSNEEQGLGIAVNSAGNAYITGYTVSTNFPTVAGGLQTTYGGGFQDAFVTMLSVGGNALVYSTYLGGSAQDHGTDLAVDAAGNTNVIGFTHSANFPTVTAFQPANGGAPDAFVTKLNAGGSALVYSSFLGGSSTEVGQGIALDSAGNAYVAGYTLSTNYPTVTPAQGTKGGSFDAFVAKIGEQLLNQPPVADAGQDQTVECQGAQTTVTLNGTASNDPNGDSLTYEWSEGSTSLGTVATLNVGLSFGSHTITLTVTDPSGASSQDIVIVNVVDTTGPSIIPPSNVTTYTGPGALSCGVVVNDSVLGTATANDGCSGSLPVARSGVPSGNFFLVGTTTITYSATDPSGKIGTATQTVTVIDNTPPTITAPSAVTVNADVGSCAATGVSLGTPTVGDNCSVAMTTNNAPADFPLGGTNVIWTVTDSNGNTNIATQFVTVVNPNPVVTITGPPSGSIYPVGTSVNFTGTFTDAGGGAHTATWMFDTISQAATVVEPTASTPGSANITYTFTTPDVYMVKLTVNDSCGGIGAATTVGGFDAMVVIYDPNGGFVTGGGWINSPAGAYAPDLNLTGKANFGFVSKYKKGATVPTGQTEFQFKVANLNFHSSVYEWLVVAGARAQYKGTGTINGAGNYGFMLTAIDGQVNGGGGIDKFRIKIWDKNNGDAIVYDNQVSGDTSDSATPNTALGGGSIVIHKP